MTDHKRRWSVPPVLEIFYSFLHQRIHVLSESFVGAVSDGVRGHLRRVRGAVPFGPVAAETGGFHATLLVGGGTAGGGRAAAAHPATLVAAAAIGQHGANSAGHRAVARGNPGAGGARSRDR